MGTLFARQPAAAEQRYQQLIAAVVAGCPELVQAAKHKSTDFTTVLALALLNKLVAENPIYWQDVIRVCNSVIAERLAGKHLRVNSERQANAIKAVDAISISLPAKPDPTTMSRLKHYGFSYDYRKHVWRALATAAAKEVAEDLQQQQSELFTEPTEG